MDLNLPNNAKAQIDYMLINKNQNGFRRKRSINHNTTDSNNPLNHWRSSYKESRGNTLACRFFQSIWFFTLRAYGLPEETALAMMMFYRNTKVKVRSPDENTYFFDVVPRVQQGYTLALYLQRLRISNIDRSNKRKWLYTKINCPVGWGFRIHRLHLCRE